VSQSSEDQEPQPSQGTVRQTGPGALTLALVPGLVIGWSVRSFCLRMRYAEPDVSVFSIVLLFFAAAIIGGTAYVTRRTVQSRRGDLAHHQAVNRLVLGKACALVGAVLVGGYLGYALAQLGVDDPGATTRLWRSLLAALGATAVTVAALLLEHACRVPGPAE
jgi:hypothetical protein